MPGFFGIVRVSIHEGRNSRMHNSASEITKICESWWGRLSDSSKVEQRAYVMKLLALLDWDLPIPFSPKATAERLNALTYLLRADGQTTIAAYFLMPGALEAPSTIVEKGLDYCHATRALMLESRSPNINYVLISDLYRTYFYDAQTEELLLHADDPAAFNRELGEYLKRGRVARGALEEIRREPRSMVARRLRDWQERWKRALSEYNSVSENTLDALMDRLLVIRVLFQHNILRRTRKRLEERFMELCAEGVAGSSKARRDCGGKLVRVLHDMWLDWRTDMFAPLAELDELLEDNDLAAPLLSECMLLSRAKFSLATILESFNHGDPTEKMRVRMVPDENEDRDYYLSRQTLETVDDVRIEIDLREEGYRAIFHWMDKLVGVYDRINLDFEAKADRETQQNNIIDLFAWSAVDARRPEACADRLGHACRKGFRIRCANERQVRIARLLLTLHLITLCSSKQQAMDYLPPIGPVFERDLEKTEPQRAPSTRLRISAGG